MQRKQSEWNWQWNKIYDDNEWLFTEWIQPNTYADFEGKDVLDCGCGGGQHVSFTAPHCRTITGVDLNATDSAKRNTARFPNATILEGDIAQMNLGRQFDVVYCIGVIHHTDDPDATFRNIAKHCKPGGRVIVWCYSYEGNFLNRTLVEGLKHAIVFYLPRPAVLALAWVLTLLVTIPVYTVYLLPLRFLPYFEYFQNWRRLSLKRNMLNVFDKLNAPQTFFITRGRIEKWFDPQTFTDIRISPYKGVSWRGSGTLSA